MLGFFILIIGILFLLKNLGVVGGIAWDIVWPLLVVAIGIKLIISKYKWH